MIRVSHALSVVLCILLLSGCASVQDRMYHLAMSTERGLSGLEEASVTLEDQTIAYLVRNGTGETIVLLHGFGANKDNWVRFVRHIPKEYRIYALDLPGHGDSPFIEDKTYSLDAITDGISRAIDELGIERFHLAGNSMGGWISTYYASLNPDRVLTLGLVDPAGVASPIQSDLHKKIEEGTNILIPTTQEEFETALEFAFHRQPFLPWPVKPVLGRKMVQRSHISEKIWNDYRLGAPEATPLLSQLTMPVLLIWGEQDRITHVSAAEVYKVHIPYVNVVILEDCGHVPMVERPRETAQHYTSFLRSHGTRVP
ncbi:MAG: alpha/beta fold hydrolase [Desulfomonilia bacterium]|nr:alpha/beta fold hydrolase [Desulfomonilia bacterium]